MAGPLGLVRPVVVVHRVAPVAGRPAAQVRAEAAALHARGDLRFGVVQQQLGEVDVQDDVLQHRAALDLARIADDERHAERLLQHQPLVEQVVLAEEVALVGRVDHHGVGGLLRAVEVPQEPADVVVDAGDRAQVVLDELLVRRSPGGGGVGALDVQGRRGVAIRRPREALLEQLQRPALNPRALGALRPQQVLRLGQGLVGVELAVAVVAVEGLVHGLEVAHEAEGPGGVLAPAEPLERQVGDDVGGVPLVLRPAGLPVLALLVEDRRVVPPLAAEDVVVVEPRRLGLQVPLAHDRRLIARPLEALGDVVRIRVQAPGERRRAVDVAVLAGQDRRPARHADRVRAEAVPQQRTLGGDAIDVLRPGVPAQTKAVAAPGLRGVVVGHDEEDVRPARPAGRPVGAACGRPFHAGGESHRRHQAGGLEEIPSSDRASRHAQTPPSVPMPAPQRRAAARTILKPAGIRRKAPLRPPGAGRLARAQLRVRRRHGRVDRAVVREGAELERRALREGQRALAEGR